MTDNTYNDYRRAYWYGWLSGMSQVMVFNLSSWWIPFVFTFLFMYATIKCNEINSIKNVNDFFNLPTLPRLKNWFSGFCIATFVNIFVNLGV